MGWSLPGVWRSGCAWLGLASTPGAPDAEVIEDIRDAMLSLLEKPECAGFDGLQRRVRYAESAAELWYLRTDVLTVLSGASGEMGAGAALAPVTAMFDRIVPPAMRSRQSPLAG